MFSSEWKDDNGATIDEYGNLYGIERKVVYVVLEQSLRSRIYEMDIVRALAILAVVLIHSTSDATFEPTDVSLSQTVFYAINRACQFAVPLFIMISGLVLFYHYYDNWRLKSALRFYQKRIWSVAIPYLVWSSIYYMFYQYISKKVIEFNFYEFLQLAIWGDIGYHLYFMILIIQFYLLFPVLLTLAKRWSWIRQGLIPLGLLIQGAFYAVSIGISFLWVGSLLLNKSFVLTRWHIPIGSCSFGIYAVHPLLLSTYKMLVPVPGAIWPYNWFTLSGFITVFGGPWIFSHGYRKLIKIMKPMKQPTAVQITS